MTYWYRIDNYQRIRKVDGSTEPLTLDEAKENLRVDSAFTLEDSLIEAMITAARTHCERVCNRYFVESDILVTLDKIPANQEPVYLPVPDMVSVTDAFSYTDLNGDNQTFGGTLTLDADFQTITPSINWPEGDMTKIEITAGPPVNIAPVKQAMQLLIGHMYETRTSSVVGTIIQDNPALDMILAPYRAELGL